MNGQKLWTRVAVMALLVLTVMAAEGGKADKQGEYCKPAVYLLDEGKALSVILPLQHTVKWTSLPRGVTQSAICPHRLHCSQCPP